MPGSGLKRWLKPAGWVLAALALGFVAYRLAAGGGAALLMERPGVWWMVAAGAAAYGASGLLLTAGWWAVLKGAGFRSMNFPTAHRIYGLTQLGKYLPGNVLHFAGRAGMARAEGWPLHETSLSMVQETGLLLIAALGIAAALGGLHWAGIPDVLVFPAGLVILALALLLPDALRLLPGPGWKQLPAFLHCSAAGRLERLGWTALALAAYLAFFAVSGLIALWIFTALGAPVPPGLVLAAVCAAWIAGFITPGASAGVGVREAVLIAALEPEAGPAAAPAALLFRIVTTGGDVLLFASGAALRRKPPPAS